MKRLRLKKSVKITGICAIVVLFLVSVITIANNGTKKVVKEDDNFVYVNDYIFDNYYPVVNQDEKISRPYTSDKVSIYKNFYDKDASEEEQKNSLIYHEDIYMQNSGVDYKSDESFDVTSVLSGTVSNITDDALLGKTIEIRSSTEIITTYQSLGEISVKKGDTVTQGQIIGKSGTCTLNSDVANGLHFEMYKNGQVINPEKFYDKSVKERDLCRDYIPKPIMRIL